MSSHHFEARGGAARSGVYARNGMICCSQPLAAQVGIDCLKRGGSAVDAAIAVNATLGLMEPTANGIGGDLFAIVWCPKTRRLHGLNACGRAPLALRAELVKPEPDGTIPLHSPFAWSVPGCVDGWFELHKKFGRLPMQSLLEPVIQYAEQGFPVSPVIAHDWQRSVPHFADKPGFRDTFMPGGRAPAAGELFKNQLLARSLRSIAAGGRDAFYGSSSDSIAHQLVDFSRQHGGFFSLEDFSKHTSSWIDPISTTYRGYELFELPPPGQGLAALQLLNILETFDVSKLSRDSPDLWHIMVEAKKLVYADRARYYADPDASTIPVTQLLSKEYAVQRAKSIDMRRAAQHVVAGEFVLNRRETTYLCCADADGMMVSLIQSNYTGHGSGYCCAGFGLQNRGALFALQDGHPNRLEPGKRPFHTIIPGFLMKDNEPLMAFGLMGGDMQPQGHMQVLVNLIDFGMNLQEAGDAARFHHSGSSEPTGTTMHDGGELHLEPTVPNDIAQELARRGHRIAPASVGTFGGYQVRAAIWRDAQTKVYTGATESRKDGCAVGY